jgi:hypothetical protein
MIVMIVMFLAIVFIWPGVFKTVVHLLGWIGLIGALDNFFEFTTVEPDATAGWAIVDFDALLVSHGERDITNWTIHFFYF